MIPSDISPWQADIPIFPPTSQLARRLLLWETFTTTPPARLDLRSMLLTVWVAPRAVLRRQNERAGRGDGHHVPLSVVRDSGSRRQAERGMVWGARLLRVHPYLLEAQSWGVAKRLLLGMAFGGDQDIVHRVITAGSLLFLRGGTGYHCRGHVLDGPGGAQRHPVHSNVTNINGESDRNLWRLEGNLEEKEKQWHPPVIHCAAKVHLMRGPPTAHSYGVQQSSSTQKGAQKLQHSPLELPRSIEVLTWM